MRVESLPDKQPESCIGEGILWHGDPDRCVCGSVFPGHLCAAADLR